MTTTDPVGTPVARLDAREKVTGTARYAYEQPSANPAYAWPVLSTIARGTITKIDTSAAEELDGVLDVLTHENAPKLADTSDREYAILTDDEVNFRGQIIGAVVAQTAEIARQGADLVRVEYAEQMHKTALDPDSDELYTPESVTTGQPADTDEGDVDAAMEAAPVTIDATYTTPMEHNNPMEPHAVTALWHKEPKDGVRLLLHDSTQGVHSVQTAVAPVLGLKPEELHVVNPYVGGGFGSKGMPHAHDILASMAAMSVPGRPVKLALTRQAMFALTGHRTPTIQRLRLGAREDGTLRAIGHDVVEHTARIKEFIEQTAVITRTMYSAPNRRTSHRIAPLDVPIPFWMRAPGETPGSFALESAMDELAVACGIDPIELRRRNEPDVDPETGLPWADRRLLECLDEGARRFGWAERDPRVGVRRDGEWLSGTGVASATYPHFAAGGTQAEVEWDGEKYAVRLGASDLGTGTWTALSQIAAEALGCPLDQVHLQIGDSEFPKAAGAGGSAGLTTWGSTVVAAARAFREQHGDDPAEGARAEAKMPEDTVDPDFAQHSFGAQFAEVAVNAYTGEIRVPRMFGVFSIGRVINPRTTRSQLIGGMTMGLSMALHEHTVMDDRLGLIVTHDLADYHVAANADVVDIDAVTIGEADPRASAMGSRGVGEIGIVGAAAAIANAVYHATGVRVRDLPITPDRLIH
ncbi:molybdopterin-dependent oxidoreductase [Epidermidibacterium keratini]|uniref:Molybdopterin-dependent oxidoreductase n=1 Tax=Epidermidibacterium keratini TaxID=1891644 RepID=A0A7L4YMQ2_9ACTN|nr:xanthine dehydrogenase family protein molybdopterin-binding subunit [Epidermidibacterium keratini]QHC00426.1 molybdopterin-dependent oxidoreductase [Epidermidibacterium keratini]